MKRALLVLSALASGCGDGGDADSDTQDTQISSDVADTADNAGPDGIDDLEREPLPVHCLGNFNVTFWHPLGDDEDHFFIASHSDASLSQTTRGGVTRDRGRTLRAVGIHSWTEAGQPQAPNQLGGREDIAALDADLYSSEANGALDALRNQLVRTVVVGDEGHDVLGVADPVALPDGAADLVWKADDDHWFARRGFRLWATRDGGANWARAGLVPQLYREANVKLVPLGEHGDTLLVQDREVPGELGVFYMIDGDAAPVPVSLPLAAPNTEEGATMRLWDERLVFIDGPQPWVSDDRGATWTRLPRLPGDDAWVHGAFAVPGGDLLVFNTIDYGEEAHIYRYAAGSDTATAPVVVDLDFAPLTIRRFGSFGVLADGRLRFVAHARPTREAYAGIVCEAGPNVTPGIETPVVEPLEAVLTSDRVVRIARLKDLNDVRHRGNFSSSGKLVGLAWQAVMSLPWDAPRLYALGDTIPNTGLGFMPQALESAASELGFAVLLGSDDPSRPNVYAIGNLVVGVAQSFPLPMTGSTTMLGTRYTANGTLLVTDRGTFHLDSLRSLTPAARYPTWPNAMFMNGMAGVVLSNVALDRLVPQLEPAFMARFVPWSEPIPDLTRCIAPPSTRPTWCQPLPRMSVLDAVFDLDGNLYVLDAWRSRVMMLPAGEASPDGWIEIGTGFLTPTDIDVRRVGDRWVVMVYDGDGFAFAVDPDGPPKVRGAGTPIERPDLPHVAERDLRDCTRDGPCLNEPTNTFIDLRGVASAPVCIDGCGFGTDEGTAHAGMTTLTVTSWNDTRVCVEPVGLIEVDGLLQVVRADGIASNRIAFVGAARLDAWDVPVEVYPDTPVRARGQNLGMTQLGQFTTMSDTYQIWPHWVGGNALARLYKFGPELLGEQSFVVRPRVQHACRAGRAQGCTLYGSGFGFTSATIGGLPARLVAPEDVSRSSRVWLAWPDALEPGVHEAVLQAAGSTTTIEVELLAESEAPLVLRQDVVSRADLEYRLARPMALSRGLFVNLDARDLFEQNGTPIPGDIVPILVETDSALEPERLATAEGPTSARVIGFATELEPSRPVHAFEHGGELYAIGTAARAPTEARVRRLVLEANPNNGKLEYRETPIGGFAVPDGIVGAVGALDGKVLVAASGRDGTRTRVTPLTLTSSSLEAGEAAEIEAAWGYPLGNGPAIANGIFLAGSSAYVTSCHDLLAGVHVVHAALDLQGETLSANAETLRDTGDARIVACQATDDGIVWVEDAYGPTSVWRHRGADGLGADAEKVVDLPDEILALGGFFETLRPVTDVALLPDGDVLLLINEHDTDARGLHLARWDADEGTWTSAHAVEPATTWQRGEKCIGPFQSAATCPGWGIDGCSPIACAVRPFELVTRPTTHIGDALMAVRGDTASIVYEVIETDPLTSISPYNGSDVLHVRVPLPE